MEKKIIVVVAFVILLVGAAFLYFKFYLPQNSSQHPVSQIKNFEECLAAGNAIMESYPRQCRTEDGIMFIEDIGNGLDKKDLITVESPRPNEVIKSPLEILGDARGVWFFEASFPVKLLDGDGNVLAQTPAAAKGEWMTENFVSFSANLTFEKPTTARGTLVLEKDNPSNLPEYSDLLIIPVKF